MGGLNYGRSFQKPTAKREEGVSYMKPTGKWLVTLKLPIKGAGGLFTFTTLCQCDTQAEAGRRYVTALLKADLPDLIEIEVMEVETIEPDRRYDYEVHTVTPYGCFFVEYFGGRKLYVRANTDITTKARQIAADLAAKNITL